MSTEHAQNALSSAEHTQPDAGPDARSNSSTTARPKAWRRRAWIAVTVLLVALIGGVVWAFGSGAVVEEIADQAEERLGLPLDFESIALDDEGVTLLQVAAATPEGDLTLRADRLRIDADLMQLRRRATGSIHGLSADGAVVRFDLDHPAAADRVATVRGLLGLDEGEELEIDEADPASEGSGTLETVLRLVRDDALIQTSGSSVEIVENGRTRSLLEDLQAEVRRLDATRVAALRTAARAPFGTDQAEPDQADSSETETRLQSLALESRGSALTPSTRGTIAWDVQAVPESRTLRGEVDWLDVSLEPLARYAESLPLVRDLERTRTGGRVLVSTDGADQIHLDGRLDLEDVTVEQARLAERPLRDLDVTLEGDAIFDRTRRQLDIARGVVHRGDAAFETVGTVYLRPAVAEGGEAEARPAAYGADLTIEMPRTTCQAFVDAIPREILSPYEGFQMSGSMSGSMKLYVTSSALGKTSLDIDVDDDCRFDRVPQQASLQHVEGPFTHQVRGHDEILFSLYTGPGTSEWTPMTEISPFMVHAVLAHEDAGFFRHDGFAVYAIEAALERNLREGGVVVGASTVSMQLAKNLFLERDRTLARKAREAVLTWWLESSLDKGEILELYLNIIEYGPEVYGLRHAADHYFGATPSELTPAQSVFLASLLPRPWIGQDQLEEGGLRGHYADEMRFLLRHMARKQRIDRDALIDGLDEIDRFSFRVQSVRRYMGGATELPIVTASLPAPPAPEPHLWASGSETHRTERELLVAGSGGTIEITTTESTTTGETRGSSQD